MTYCLFHSLLLDRSIIALASTKLIGLLGLRQSGLERLGLLCNIFRRL